LFLETNVLFKKIIIKKDTHEKTMRRLKKKINGYTKNKKPHNIKKNIEISITHNLNKNYIILH